MNQKNNLLDKHFKDFLVFSNYYKYEFEYRGKNVLVKFGGNYDDIYRLDLISIMTLEEILKEVNIEDIKITEVKK